MERFPSTGTIAPGSFPRLVADLHRHGATGSLKVDGPTHHKALYFRNGRILFGSSDDPKDQLGPILVAAGAVTEEQVRAEIIKVEPGKPLAQVLGEAGIVSQEALSDAAETKMERILADVLTCPSGHFEFEDGVLPKGAVDLRLSTPRLFLAAARSAGVDLANMVIGPGEPVLRRREGGEAALEELGPTAASMAQALDGERSLGVIGEDAGLTPRNAQAIATGLVLLGLAEPVGAPRFGEPTPEPFAPLTALDDTPPGIPLDPSLDTLRDVQLDESVLSPESETPVESTQVFAPEPLALDFSSGQPPVVKTAVGISTAQLRQETSPRDEAPPAPPPAEATPPPDAETIPMRIPVSAPPPAPQPEPAPLRSVSAPKVDEFQPSASARPSIAGSRFDAFEQTPGERFVRRPSGPFSLGRPRRSALPALAMIGVVLGAVGVALWLWLNVSPRDAAPVTTAESPEAAPSIEPSAEPAGVTGSPRLPDAGGVAAPTPPPSSRRDAPRTPPPQRSRRLAAGYEDAAVRLRRGDVAAAARGFAAALPDEGYTIQLLVACSPETAIKAAGQTPSADLFVVPLRFQGRDCYRVLYGRYASEPEAREALERSVPAYFKQTPSRPRIESLATVAR